MKKSNIKDLFIFAFFEQIIERSMEWLFTTTFINFDTVIQIQQNIYV